MGHANRKEISAGFEVTPYCYFKIFFPDKRQPFWETVHHTWLTAVGGVTEVTKS